MRVDMSEFMEKHSVARLIGAPPGYVGYDEGGALTEAVRRKPYSGAVARRGREGPPRCLQRAAAGARRRPPDRRPGPHGGLQEHRHRDDQQPRLAHDHADGRPGTSELIREAVKAEVKQHFRPEFLNRIDETVVFHALDESQIRSIAVIQLKVLEARLEKMELRLDVSAERCRRDLAKVGFDPVFGARPLKRAIQQRIENPVAKLILEGRFGPKDVIPVDVDGRRVRLLARRSLKAFSRAHRGRAALKPGAANPRRRLRAAGPGAASAAVPGSGWSGRGRARRAGPGQGGQARLAATGGGCRT